MKTVLNREVLILNKSWSPIRIQTVLDALTLVYRKRAAFVDVKNYSVYGWNDWAKLPIKEDEEYIATSQASLRIPKVVVLTHFNNIPTYRVNINKRTIFERDGWTCQYTGKKVTLKSGNLDHVIPKSKGGKRTWNNIVCCDAEVNSIKDNRTPEEAGLKLLKEPAKMDYSKTVLTFKEGMPEEWRSFLREKK